MAKPVAVDVPGCLRVESAGKAATEKRKAFLVDYQIPTDPVNIQVAERVRKGELGKLAMIATIGISGRLLDPPKTTTIESRLQNLIWDFDIPLGGSFIVSFDIHAIDVALWIVGQRPVAAMGTSRICRIDPHGDSHDTSSVVFEYADGLIHQHSGCQLPNGSDGEIGCKLLGQAGHAVTSARLSDRPLLCRPVSAPAISIWATPPVLTNA